VVSSFDAAFSRSFPSISTLSAVWMFPPSENVSDRSSSSAYWDSVGEEWLEKQPQLLWREFTDRLQINLLRKSNFGQHGLRLLKTDLFDEVAGRGVVRWAMNLGAAVTGIDLSPLIAALAAGRNPGLRAVVADVRDLPFGNGSFDVVFSGSTLDHFVDRGSIHRSLQELNRILRGGGMLILTMDNPHHPLVRLRNTQLQQLLRPLGVVPYMVGVTLGQRELVQLLRLTGFSVQSSTAILHSPRLLAVWIAKHFESAPAWQKDAFLDWLGSWEKLERWPSRYFTGHYISIQACKPEGGDFQERCHS
jgi:SAM-dependent methyltransferase